MKKFLKFVIWLLWMFLLIWHWFAWNAIEVQKLLSWLNDELKELKSKDNKKWLYWRRLLVYNFCENMWNISEVLDYTFVDTNNSFFLYSLCNATWIYTVRTFWEWLNWKWLNVKITSYFKQLIDDAEKNKKLKMSANMDRIFYLCWITDGYLLHKSSLNNVDFVCVARYIFDKLASDYVNIALFFAYWWWKEWFDSWQKHFFWTKYISSDSESTHRNVYKTVVKPLLKNIEKKISVSNIIHISNKWELYAKLWWIKWVVNYIYNELFFYVLFLSYYTSNIWLDPTYFSSKKVWDNPVDFNSEIQEEINEATFDITLSRLAIKASFNIIKNIYWTYPIHLWLLCIIEDFKKFRSILAKVYTPIDQLRYKLENVQDLDKK
jgi:hypothetical protein